MEFQRALIGNSPRMRLVQRQVEKLGNTRWPVLILGETGTGKEVVARSIYGCRPAGPFVTVDCSALVGPLMESELFGHAKGAFTGAIASKLGMIEMADGGTVFLDEVGELPIDMQMKLLRVLQEKEFRPVGGLASRKSDFRIISATNRDLAADVEKGTFRRDLYYRLNVVTLRLSPLRERQEDIPELIQHFLKRHGKNHTITPETIDALVTYDWPGNVRELENCIQHMIAMNSGPLLHLPDLPSALMHFHEQRTGHMRRFTVVAGAGVSPLPKSPMRVEPPPMVYGEPPVIPLPELEKRAIMNALRHTKGDRATAAVMLGIGRTTLYRKLKEYHLEEVQNLTGVRE
jgi:DNA-binding NtrC family response regulator